MLTQELKSQINQLWNIFWSWGMSNPLTSVEQISYLIFMKRIDEIDKQNIMKASRVKSYSYKSVFEGNFEFMWKNYDKQLLRWSHWSVLPADEMFPFVRDVVFNFIKSLESSDWFAWSLKDASFLIPKASMLATAVSVIENLKITEQNEDTAWDIYEYLLNEISSAWKNWQFRTPRHIIQMIVDILNPTKNDKICDPACGSWWFLVNAYKHIIKSNTSEEGTFQDENWIHYSGDRLSTQEWERIKKDNLHWYDFDTTMVRVAMMNNILHWISNPNISYKDTLWKSFEHSDEFDIILANPPFKWSIDRWDLSSNFLVDTTKTELLFLELIYNKLTVWWRCWVIVPDWVLFGTSNAHKKVRELLVEKCWLKAVISLPSWVFKPYAWVSTAILVFTKWDTTKKVWYYNLEADGFSLDDKRNKLSDDQNDIPDIQTKYKQLVLWKQFDQEPQSWEKWFWVEKEEIIKQKYDLSISRYKKIEYTPVQYEDPRVLISQIKELESKLSKWLEELEKML